jgi:hypothetical protein
MAANLTSANRAVAVTPHDDTVFENTRAIVAAAAGNATVKFADSATPVLVHMLAGAVYPYEVTKVMATGTHANMGIVALY